MRDFFIWIYLFFFLRRERKEQRKRFEFLKSRGIEITKPSIEDYTKEFQNTMSRVFGYKRTFTSSSLIIFLVNDILTEIEMYHLFYNEKGSHHSLDLTSLRTQDKIRKYTIGYYGLEPDIFKNI